MHSLGDLAVTFTKATLTNTNWIELNQYAVLFIAADAEWSRERRDRNLRILFNIDQIACYVSVVATAIILRYVTWI